MSLDQKHPEYTRRALDWRVMRDTYDGERTVKNASVTYLPATQGMVEDGFPNPNTSGTQQYEAYRIRARFPDVVREAVEALLGVMHGKPAVITLPEPLEYLLTRASNRGETLQQLLERITFQQLTAGRLGLMADVVDAGPHADQFYVALYDAEAGINWDTGVFGPGEVETLNLVVLDESSDQREPGGFNWRNVRRYRVLLLGGLDAAAAEGTAEYRTAVFTETDDATLEFDVAALQAPEWKGRRLDRLPFVFVNSRDLSACPDRPPLLGLANLTLTIYRGEADYRQSLFMQGQDTLVKIGAVDDPESAGTQRTRVGIGAVINIPTPSGDAKFIGVDSKGLPEQRQALQNDYGSAEQHAGRLMDSVTRERESGQALRIRVATRTATLNQIAQAGAAGLEQILKRIAVWAGLDPAAVSVTPNLDFVDDHMTGSDALALMQAKDQGLPISYEMIHKLLQNRSMTELSFEEEMTRIAAEREIEKNLRPRFAVERAAGTTGPAPSSAGGDKPQKTTQSAEGDGRAG